MSHDAIATIVGHIAILITTIVGFVFAWLREGRRHRWQQDENRKMREEVSAVAAEVKNGKAH